MVKSNTSDCIRLRGVRQNNLKGFDLDVPLGCYIVVTGVSGSGKSSLVFETLHAEGQRRYVETFSAYTRQFLELLAKPRVDAIENIRPSIAIEQTNTVKTSRSTVGTMTEITDYCKVWFSHVAECFEPETREKVEDDNPAFARDQHVGRLDIAMYLPRRMDGRQPLGELREHLTRAGLVQVADLATQGRAQVGTLDHLHGEEPALSVGKEIAKSNYVPVTDVRSGTEFILEPTEQTRLQPGKQLERDPNAELAILGLVDNAHASLPQEADQLKTLRPAKSDRTDFAGSFRSKHITTYAA